VRQPSVNNFATTGGMNAGNSGTETRPANFSVYYYIRVN